MPKVTITNEETGESKEYKLGYGANLRSFHGNISTYLNLKKYSLVYLKHSMTMGIL